MKPFELFSGAPNAGQKAPTYPLEDLNSGMAKGLIMGSKETALRRWKTSIETLKRNNRVKISHFKLKLNKISQFSHKNEIVVIFLYFI